MSANDSDELQHMVITILCKSYEGYAYSCFSNICDNGFKYNNS